MTLAAFLGGLDLAAVVVIAIVVLVPLLQHRAVKVGWGKVQASVDAVKDESVKAAEKAAEAKLAAADVAEAVGPINGNGDLMTMVARALAELAEMRGQTQEILQWQGEHSAEDEHRRVDMLNRITELATYTHDGVHELRNLMTPVKAKVDLMWPHHQAETEEET